MIKQKKIYQICNNCVMDTSDPKISFDKNGNCDHCQNFYKNIKKEIVSHNQNKTIQLNKLITQILKSKNDEGYNCLVGLSGGVDSSYLLHLIVTKMKLNPLIVHVDTGWNSKESVNNIEKLVDKLDLDLHTEVINWREMRDLQVSFFKAGHPNLDIPQDHAIWASIHNLAVKKKIPYLITGGNLATECIREPLEWSYHASDVRHIKDIQKKFGKIKLKTFPLCNIFTYKIFYKYFKNLKTIQILDFISFNKQNAIDILQREYGWINYSHKHYESRFTKFFEGYWLRKKFNIDVRKVHFSSLILNEQMDREEALRLLKKNPYDETEILNEINYIKKKLNLSDTDFENYLNAPSKSFKDYKSYNHIIQFLIKICRFLKLEKRLIR
jgi:N-acetyl sugar amidotransferase